MNNQLNQEISEVLIKNKTQIAESVTFRQYELYPELIQKYGENGKDKCLKDTEFQLSCLSEAISDSSPELFSDYIVWSAFILSGRNVPVDNLINNLTIFKEKLKNFLSDEMYLYTNKYIETGLSKLKFLPPEPPSFIQDNQPYGDIAKNYLNALLKGERQSANKIIVDCVNSGTKVKDIYLHIFQKSQYEIGRLWQLNKISVAQEHYTTAATQLIMSQLYPYIFNVKKNGYSLIATCIEDDLHEIGIRMIADFFEMEGWNTFYLGANTPISAIISTIIERKANLLAISATMTSNIKKVEYLIKIIRLSDVCKDLKIIVGGYPFNIDEDLWKHVGADGFAKNAEEAILMTGELITK